MNYCQLIYKLDNNILRDNVVQELLFQHELNCLARFVKSKFNNDLRSLFQLKQIIVEELLNNNNSYDNYNVNRYFRKP